VGISLYSLTCTLTIICSIWGTLRCGSRFHVWWYYLCIAKSRSSWVLHRQVAWHASGYCPPRNRPEISVGSWFEQGLGIDALVVLRTVRTEPATSRTAIFTYRRLRITDPVLNGTDHEPHHDHDDRRGAPAEQVGYQGALGPSLRVRAIHFTLRTVVLSTSQTPAGV
jgi:hypothetical protein